MTTADEIIAKLRAHEAELRAAGIERLSLFGSVARGEDGPDSDVDLLAQLDRSKPMNLLDFEGLQTSVTTLLARRVDLMSTPVRKERLARNIERDARNAF